jgi:hypothetical protein
MFCNNHNQPVSTVLAAMNAIMILLVTEGDKKSN